MEWNVAGILTRTRTRSLYVSVLVRVHVCVCECLQTNLKEMLEKTTVQQHLPC